MTTTMMETTSSSKSNSSLSTTTTSTTTSTTSTASNSTPERRRRAQTQSSPSDRAQCVLTVPNHNLHCYPVNSPEDSQGKQKKELRLLPNPRRMLSTRTKRSNGNTSSSISTASIKLFSYWIILLMTWTTFQVSSNLSDHHAMVVIPTVPTIHDDQRAIFLISMGRQAAESKIVERFLMSTRRRGSWKGHVVLLTDAPHDRYRHLQHQDDHFIVMHPRPEHFNWNTKKDMPYKRFKTYVLDYIDSEPRLDSVRLVYYLDVDIIVGKECR